ncbi:MAG: GNAT family N-acetyltransferase [Woeseiaceae bacterium]
MKPPAINYQWTTPDGTPVTIRPIQAEDRDIELAFVRGLSPGARYRRFFSTVKDLSPQLLDRFTQVDFPSEMAFIATVQAAGAEIEIGVARYAPGSVATIAEFAVVVADDWQGHGIGRELMHHLLVVAEDAGFEHIEGAVLKSNSQMIRFCRELGFAVKPYPDDAQLVLVAKDV